MSRPLRRPFRAGPVALACIAMSLGLVVLAGVLGTSAAQPPLPGRAWWPPAPPGNDPSPWLVTGLLLAAVAAGVAGLGLGLRALARGWSPRPVRLVAAGAVGCLAMVAVPPMGSADVLVYAAYGRIAATGGDPYVQTARDLAARGDPVGAAVEAPWRDTPSVYGPLATAQHRLAAELGGTSVRATVGVLALTGALAYAITGLLLLRLAGASAARRRRVALLWWLNPLLLYAAVNGAHVDAFGVAWAVVGLLAVRRSALAAGALVGAAVAVKATFGLYGLALIWALRREPRRLAALAVGAAGVVLPAYAVAGPQALDQLRSASRSVSFASPWRLLVGPLEAVFEPALSRSMISAAAAVAFAALAVALARLVAPGDAASGGSGPGSAVRAAAVLGVAWLLTSPYALPWYDVVAWAPLAAMPASALDGLLLARTGVISLGYVPGRVVPLPGALAATTRGLRGAVAPVALTAVVAVAVRLGGSRRRTSGPTGP